MAFQSTNTLTMPSSYASSFTMPSQCANELTTPFPITLKPIPNTVKTSPLMTHFLSDLTGPRTFLPTPPLSPLPIHLIDISPGNRASNNIIRIRPYIRGITPPCEEYELRERENDGYMGPVWDDDRTGMYHPSEKGARRLERRLGVGEDVERVRRRKRGVYERRRRREREVERERARAEVEGEGEGEGGEGDGGSGVNDEGDGEEMGEQETATSASESEPRTSLVVTLTTTSETGKACLQALGVAGGRRTRKRFYEQPTGQGPSSRKKARMEMPDDEASTQMSLTSVAIPAAPNLEPMEEGGIVAEVSTSLAGALTDMTLVETHGITPTPAEEFKDKNQDEIGEASSVPTDHGKGDPEICVSLAEVVTDEPPINENAASSKPAKQSTDENQEKTDKVPPSLPSKTSHKKQTKLDAIFGISKGKSNCKKQSKIDKLFPVVKSQPRKKAFCTCRKREFGFMIYCDGPCGEWYHGRCVGITAGEGKKMDKYFCKSCTAASAVTPDDAAVEDVALHDAVEPVTALDLVAEEAPKSATPVVQVEPNTTPVKDLKSTSSVAPAATPQDVITARLKYFSPSSVTQVTVEKPAAVQEPMVLTTHDPSNNAEKSFAQVLHTFTTLRGGAIRFDFGSCKDIFED